MTQPEALQLAGSQQNIAPTNGISDDHIGVSKGEIIQDELSRSGVVHTHVHLRWENIVFDVDDSFNDEKKKPNEVNDEEAARPPSAVQEGMKRILHNIRGQVAPGEVVAIMGPSGSGKTSLLNILARRVKRGVSGDILLNGEPIRDSSRRVTGYVMQDDAFFTSLTVYENLHYAAQLKLPETLSKDAVNTRVEQVIKQLDLEKTRNSLVGMIGAGISGGERRRLAIAIELLNEPSLLLLDEPTSGLDAASALMIANILHSLAKDSNRAVLCTLHQPRASIMARFDKIVLLADGKLVYFGPPGDECMSFFSANGYECPRFENPADFMLDLINTRLETNESDPNSLKIHESVKEGDFVQQHDRRNVALLLAAEYEKSDLAKEHQSAPSMYPPPLNFDDNSSKFITSWWNQYSVVCRRSFLHKVREPLAAVTQAFNGTILPFIVGTIYWQLGFDQNDGYDRLKAISLLILLQSFMAYDILLLFPVERCVSFILLLTVFSLFICPLCVF